MRYLGLVCCLVMLVALPARSSTYGAFDSVWWNQLSASQQVAAVMGAISAFRGGYVEGIVAATAPGSSARAIAAKHLPGFSHIMGFYVSAVTDFYVRYPEGSHAEIGDVLSCLSDNPWTPCSDVAKHSHP